MCYPKPGPRCSAHAAANLQRVKHLEETTKEYSFELEDAVAAAQLEYDATPAGQRELERRIQQQVTRKDMKPNDKITGEYQLRLDLGRAKRSEQLAAIKTKDRGDIRHKTSRQHIKFPPAFHRFQSEYANLNAVFEREDYLMNNPEIVDLVIKDSEAWTEKLTVEETEAAAWFTSNGSSVVNNHLLGQRSPYGNGYDADPQIAQAAAENLDSAISKSRRDTPIKVYRGLSNELLEAQGYKYKEGGKFVTDTFKVGDTWSTPVFQSTTLDYRKAQGFAGSGVTLEILAKTAAPVTNISAWDVSEMELIINRNQQYRVVDIKNFTKTLRTGRGKEFHYDEYVVQLEEI